jgi:isopenicillin N synthase-like dioxygenase
LCVQSAEFFRLPDETKGRLAWDDPRANRGYVKVGRERVSESSKTTAEIAALRAKAPDTKESMEIGREDHPTFRNKWPQENEAPEFKQTMLHFFQVREICHVE